jgi:hypothetical protein
LTNRPPPECVVLVPVGGSIDPGCEAGLRVLEQRGYQVRRVRGFSQIDVGRSQLATDALRDGFQELFWIDSDVVFDPNDVERLRSHQLPFSCGIYAKKSRREFACSFLPDTKQVIFGANGSLTEILYAGFGFVHTHRSLYETIRQNCNLPECNAQFGSVLHPYFMPFPLPHGSGYWYLGEDYAFCERARQCGCKIMLDTQIRLWHVGSYSFGWEDAGTDKERFGTYTFNLNPPTADDKPFARPPGSQAIQKLASRHPWPLQQPDLDPPKEDGWLYPSAKEMLRSCLNSNTRIVVELGSWTGLSTRFIADCAPQATVIAIDHWKGSAEHRANPELAPRLGRLYDEFLSACWRYKDRIVAMRTTTDEGLCDLRDREIVPDLIYLDADHGYESVLSDICLANHLFPATPIVGDDWDWESVRRAVEKSASDLNRNVQIMGTAWKLEAKLFS